MLSKPPERPPGSAPGRSLHQQPAQPPDRLAGAPRRLRYAELTLRKDLTATLRAGHPWVYRDALLATVHGGPLSPPEGETASRSEAEGETKSGVALPLRPPPPPSSGSRPPRAATPQGVATGPPPERLPLLARAPGPAEPATGDPVDVLDEAGRFVARGRYHRTSPIAVRVFSLDPAEAIDGELVRRRLAAALRARRGAIDAATTTAFRWCNGEGDRLPGLVIDVYGAVAVVRFDDEAARTEVATLTQDILSLGEGLGLRTVYERSRAGQGTLLAGPMPEAEFPIREHGTTLLVDVIHGQKTGLFLDQRDNRLLIRQVAGGLSVWNGFCYTGGFSVQAALGGASRVVSVDSAEAALSTARRTFLANGLDPAAHAFFAEDVFVHLRRAIASAVRHGLVIVDPPSFAPSEKALPRALSAYRDLFALALQVVEPGGLLAAASCSSHVDLPAFLSALGDAAVRVGRPLRLLEVRGQPADHPSLPAFPEGRYLKFALCRLD